MEFGDVFSYVAMLVPGLGIAFGISYFAEDWIAKKVVALSNFWLPVLWRRHARRVPWRMRLALPLRAGTVTSWMILCCLNPFVVGFFLDGPWTLLFIPYSAIAVGSILIGWKLLSSPTFFALRATLARMAVARVVRMRPQGTAQSAVHALVDVEEGTLEDIAAKYRGLLPDATVEERLAALRESASTKVATLAKQAMQATEPLDVIANHGKARELNLALQRYRIVLREHPSEAMHHTIAHHLRVEAAEDEIDLLLLPQVPLKAALPHLFCELCLARHEECNEAGWWWLRCKQCKESDRLLPDVQRAIGQIGAGQTQGQDGVRFICNVWDEATKQAIPAEIDALDIIGGSNIDYNWAISKVVTMLEDRGYVPDKKLPIRIMNEPPLETNSLAVLRRIGEIELVINN